MTLKAFNKLLIHTYCYCKVEVVEEEKLLWLMVLSDPKDEATNDTAVIRIHGPKDTPVNNMVEQCHDVILRGGTKMAIMAFQNKMEEIQAAKEPEKTEPESTK